MSFDDPRAQWWIDHVKHTREYVNGVFNKKPQQVVEAVKGLWRGVMEWGHITGSGLASALMGEHTIIAKLFADSAERGFKPNESDYLVAYFLKNKDAQADLYASIVPNFPKAEFVKLFTEHIVLTGAYIAAAAKGDMPTFKTNYQKVLDNMRALANFSLHAFPAPKLHKKESEEHKEEEKEDMGNNDENNMTDGGKSCF
jgi:hypothetical protein